MACFQHEDPQHRRRSGDIGVHSTEDVTQIGASGYAIYKPFMIIEAKRLPAPTRDREREYVTGTNQTTGSATGGIQRFKLGQHGAQVETSVIVGYIQSQTVQHWHAAINQWITDLVAKPSSDGCDWSQTDTLGQLFCNEEQGTSTTESTHQRFGECVTPFIRIHHFWIVMRSARP